MILPVFPKELDNQHKVLSYLHNLIIESSEDKEQFYSIVKVYKEYRNRHMIEEERYMVQTGYIELKAHCKSHNSIQKLEDSLLLYGMNKDKLEYCFRTWKHHIVTYDKDFMIWNNNEFSSTDNGI